MKYMLTGKKKKKKKIDNLSNFIKEKKVKKGG